MEQEKTPEFLYKILPMSHWQGTLLQNHVMLTTDDMEFIHFSKQDQLERICQKYWSDAHEYVILKVTVEKLVGDLVFETNPGGSAKYYHLYDGSIPLEAIVEARVIYQKKAPESKLTIVEVGDPVLRQIARPLSVEEIKSQKIQTLIDDMISTMRQAPGVGVAAPQVGHSLQLIVIEDRYTAHLTEEEKSKRDRRPFPLQVIINPKIEIVDPEPQLFYEGCLSGPSCLGVTPRARAVRVQCLNELAEPVVIEAEGWQARILQHEIDHLYGRLFVDHADLTTLTTQKNYQEYWRNAPIPCQVAQKLENRVQ